MGPGLGPKFLPSHTSKAEVERIIGLARNINVDSVFPRPTQLDLVAGDFCQTVLQRNDVHWPRNTASMLRRYSSFVRNQQENESLCHSRLDLTLITAADMEKSRFQQFLNDPGSNLVDTRTKQIGNIFRTNAIMVTHNHESSESTSSLRSTMRCSPGGRKQSCPYSRLSWVDMANVAPVQMQETAETVGFPVKGWHVDCPLLLT
jgi:hypothetical protein